MSEKTMQILKNLSILIVEDDEIAREVITEGLKPYCKSVHNAKDGYAGLEAFTKFNADVILTDIHMPMMNGFDMMEQILKLKPHQKFIVFTSYDTDDNLIKSLEYGATMFLKKPIDVSDLYRALVTLAYKGNERLIKISQNITINLEKEKIYKDGDEIYLTFLQNKFFWLLAYNLNSLVSYDMIEEFVYENEPVNKNAIQKVASRLKKELGVNIKNLFENGYMLSA